MSINNARNQVYLTKAEWETLISSGSVTLASGTTVTYSPNDTYYIPEETATTTSDGLMSATDKTKLDGIEAGAKTGTVTSVTVKMNGSTKGTVTTSGEIDLGNVITDISDKMDKVNPTGSGSMTIGTGDLAYGLTSAAFGTGEAEAMTVSSISGATLTTSMSSAAGAFQEGHIVRHTENGSYVYYKVASATDSSITLSSTPAVSDTSNWYRIRGIAYGKYAYTVGECCTASGNRSYTSGYRTIASSYASHAEGWECVANGNRGAHAEGYRTSASGYAAHSAGESTIANHRGQFAFGTFNNADTSSAGVEEKGTYIEIVGNGTATNARSNARTLDWSGNEVLAGSSTASSFVKINGTSSQFLKADGSVDSNTYQPTSTAVTHTASTAVGSATQPTFVASNGVATACTYSLEKSVPSDAVFTDTTYEAEKGIALSNGKFGHSNTAITAQTTQAVYPIKIDAYGHITEYGSAVSIPVVNNPTISFTQGGVAKGSFTLNQSEDATIPLDAGGGSALYMHYISTNYSETWVKLISTSATPITTYSALANYASKVITSSSQKNQIIKVSYIWDLGESGYHEQADNYNNVLSYEITSSGIKMAVYYSSSQAVEFITDSSGIASDVVVQIQ